MADIDLNRLKNRLEEIDADILRLESELDDRRREKAEIQSTLQKVIALISSEGPNIKSDAKLNAGKPSAKILKPEANARMDYKILYVLQVAGDAGLKTDDIHEAIRREFGEKLVISSMRTALSTLKKEGQIHSIKRVWFSGPETS